MDIELWKYIKKLSGEIARLEERVRLLEINARRRENID